MKILVTGADGFIGSHLVEKLVKIGYDVTALCYYNSFSSIGNLIYLDKKILKKVKIKHGDIRDKDFIEKLVKGKDFVFNLAALIGIPYSYDAYDSYLDTNIKGTLNLLSAIKKNPKIFFVHTSTSEVYGSAQYVPIDENHPQVAQSPYAATKIAADQLVVSFLKSFNIKACIVRPFNTFGPRQSLRAIIPTAINQIIDKPKNIFFGNLNTYRDLTYIEDTIDAFCLCIKNKDRIIGSILNLGVGKCYLIKDVIKKIMKLESSKSNIVIKEIRIRPKKSEVEKLVSSNVRARKLIKWKPKYSSQKSFDEALKKTINWFKENKNHSANADKYII
jgi:NAD dependent epimerase/dehydratase